MKPQTKLEEALDFAGCMVILAALVVIGVILK